MLFSKSRKFDFPPEVKLPDSENFLDVIKATKLLGIQITTDLKWNKKTLLICKRANLKLWMLRRMNILGIDPISIVDFNFKEVRST